jgi:hypothetical protein
MPGTCPTTPRLHDNAHLLAHLTSHGQSVRHNAQPFTTHPIPFISHSVLTPTLQHNAARKNGKCVILARNHEFPVGAKQGCDWGVRDAVSGSGGLKWMRGERCDVLCDGSWVRAVVYGIAGIMVVGLATSRDSHCDSLD